ncbi:MAG: DUF2511 domain-containing protein [Acidobacteria bacterium]|nr:DUF2511 domain-containing protein [Acidobacteriota bacterium]
MGGTRTGRAAAQRAGVLVCLGWAAACADGSPGVSNPIPDLPLNQQRTVTRTDFNWEWPFTIGVGTLGCASGAVVFRSGNVTYALNDAAAKGFASPRPIQLTVDAGPRNPLARIKQDTRMQIFAQTVACRASASAEPSPASAPCTQRIRDTHGLTEDELKQIEAEGRERRWRPLPAEYTSVAPLVDEGLKLCPK